MGRDGGSGMGTARAGDDHFAGFARIAEPFGAGGHQSRGATSENWSIGKMGKSIGLLLWSAMVAMVCFCGAAWGAVTPCEIEVVEKGSGWPVPLVELRTVNGVRFVTDNAGIVAFDLPELMGKETWLYVQSPGYEVKKDEFGNAGVRLKMEPGGHHRIEVERTIIARRLGRVTGAGLFGESQKLGKELDWKESGIVGCDTVQNTVYRGKLYWMWGDTMIAKYPLGIFDGTGATTLPQPLSKF